MALHEKTFDYMQPTVAQIDDMGVCRQAFKRCAETVEAMLPDGSDKTHVLRLLRTAGMWANVAITRQPDGAPRTDQS